MDYIVHRIAKSRKGLSDFDFTSLHFDNQVDLGQAKEENPIEPLQTSPQTEILPLDPLL